MQLVAGSKMEESRGGFIDPSTLVVGLNVTPESREMLTWIVSKLTQPGDHVIGVHVLRFTPDAEYIETELDPSTRQQLDDTFEAMLDVYQGLCTLKHIQLDIKVVTATSLQEGLVEVSRIEKATKLILGSSAHRAVRCRHSLANHCSKSLPSYCSVLVFECGKIIHEKQGMHPPGHKKSSTGIWQSLTRSNYHKLNKNKKLDAQKGLPSVEKDTDSSSSLSSDGHPCDNCITKVSLDSPVSVLCFNMNEERLQASHSQIKECSTIMRTRSKVSAIAKDDYSDHTVQDGSSETCRSAFKVKVRCINLDDSLQKEGSCYNYCSAEPGWPFMHRTMSLENMASSLTSARRMSVVKWALQLPDRRKESIKVPLVDKKGKGLSLMITEPLSNGGPGRESPVCSLKGSVNGQESCCRNNARCDTSEIKYSVGMADVTNQAMSSLTVKNDARDSSYEAKELPRRALTLEKRLETLLKSRSCSWYTYEELEMATSNFCPENFVGKGGYSKVYKGILQNGQRIAVKCLNEKSPNAEQELLTEVEVLMTLRHRHIIMLLGYYIDSKRHLLVYNLASKGNLDENLHGGLETPTLEWGARFKIAVGAAQGLEYLHDGSPLPVIHKDLKSSNILLSDDFEAQISDFGLAKWAPTSLRHITCSDVVGTFGYLAPEYFMFGKVNEKTDVYSFGVVLLELITGRRPIDVLGPKGKENLVLWARRLIQEGKGEHIIDSKLKQSYDKSQMKHLIQAASLCTSESPQSRPGIRQVVRVLCGELDDMPYSTQNLFVFKDKEECSMEECFG